MEKQVLEIGSNFHELVKVNAKVQETSKVLFPWEEDGKELRYTFSGRDAIKMVLLDIRQKKRHPVVYMPSYVCDSMLDPFLEAGWDIKFYDVIKKETGGLVYDIHLDEACELFFAMSYFGCQSQSIDQYVKHFHKRGIKILEDVTHRLLSKPNHSPQSDYHIGSLRKWLPIASGGFVRKQQGQLCPVQLKEPVTFAKLRWDAMEEKRVYLEVGEESHKDSYMKKFQVSERFFKKQGPLWTMDIRSQKLLEHFDFEEIRKKRIHNKDTLREGLSFLKNEWFLFLEEDTGDCPLFYPLYLPQNLRDSLRNYLSNHKIYCPVHWPWAFPREKGIEQHELSLVIDQRYGKEEMERMVMLIKVFMKEYAIEAFGR